MKGLLIFGIALFCTNASAVENLKTLNIMPLGDSITFAKNYPGGYRIELERLLAIKGIKANFVGSQSNGSSNLKSRANEGHPGWTIGQLARNTPQWIKKYKPQVVLLMIGTNDMSAHEAAKKPDVASAVHKLKRLVDTILKYDADSYLVLASIPPTNAHWNRYVVRFNAGIKDIVLSESKSGKNVHFADVYSAMEVNDLDPSEGMQQVHPSAEGYDKIGKAFFLALAPFYSVQ